MKGFKSNDLIKLFKEHGWKISHRKSSHVSMCKEGNKNIITIVDNHNKEVCRPLAQRLLKLAGINV